MRKLLFGLVLSAICYLVFTKQIYAISEIKTNNKFGIHLASFGNEDLKAAARLINSQGGEWGYVTVVIPDNDLDVEKWQAYFDEMRQLKLIPIVRLATHAEGNYWVKPKPEDSQKWLRFLNSLNWVIKNRYVILFNEPNHAAEWGNEVNPNEYAKVALQFAKTFTSSSADYFVMLAGLDQAAPQQLPSYASAPYFLQTVLSEIGVADFEANFAGLSSHSYPNPGFSAPPYYKGWGSVAGYEAELLLLQEMGVNKTLPVFITETGWQQQIIGEEAVADNLLWAYNNLWLPDTRVVAVTPFVLNYQSEPFLGFSWQKQNSHEFYQQYEAIRFLNKISGRPEIEENISFLNRLPKELVEDSSFRMKLQISNLGQGFWDKANGYELRLISQDNFFYRFASFNSLSPGQSGAIDFEFHTPKQLGQSKVKLGLYHYDQKKLESPWWPIKIVPLQKLTLKYRLLDFKNSGTDFKVLLYDQYENLVFEKAFLNGEAGTIMVNQIRNVALGERYRVVLLKPGFLPRQNFVVFKAHPQTVNLKLMWPLDFNQDGKWSFADIKSLFSLGN